MSMKRSSRKNPITTAADLGTLRIVNSGLGDGTVVVTINDETRSDPFDPGTATTWAAVHGDPSENPALMAALENIVGNYEPEALALFERMAIRPNANRRTTINTLIKTLKEYGLWTKLDGFYVLAAHTQQAALLNWRRNSANLTAVNSPVFTESRGFAGDGATAHLVADPATIYTQPTDHMVSAWVTAAPAPVSDNEGQLELTNWQARILSRTAAGYLSWRAASTSSMTVTVENTGLFTVARTAAAAAAAYRNGSQVQTDTAAYNAGNSFATTGPLYLLRRASFYSASSLSFACYGAGLDAAKTALLYNAVADYMQAVGVI